MIPGIEPTDTVFHRGVGHPIMSLAAETREAVRARPFLLEGLRADVVNYAAAARSLGIAEDTDAVATALRRFAETVAERETTDREVRVTMQGSVERGRDDSLLTVGDVGFGTGDGPMTAVLVTGEVDADALSHTLGVLAANDVAVVAAGVGDDALVVLVDRQDGPEALRRVEAALEAVPTKTTV